MMRLRQTMCKTSRIRKITVYIYISANSCKEKSIKNVRLILTCIRKEIMTGNVKTIGIIQFDCYNSIAEQFLR